MINKILIIFFGISIFGIVSCRKDKVGTINVSTQIVSFSAKIKPMIDVNCISCHGPGQTAPDLSTYSSIALNATNILNSLKAEGVQLMPLGGPALNESLINDFSTWIYQGKQNN